MIYLIRIIFLALICIVAFAYLFATLSTANGPATHPSESINIIPYAIMVGSVVLAFAIITIDLVVKKKNLSALSGLLFGILVGVLISFCLGFLLNQIAETFLFRPTRGLADAELRAAEVANENLQTLLSGIKLMIGLMVTYITTSFVLQTKDDFRFIIPYVEFQRATRGPRPLILDTSVIIDGRIADLAATGMFESTVVVPRFVLNELQTIADSADRLKRSRGRRGLDVLEKLKALPRIEFRFWDGTLAASPETEGVDQKLVALAQQEHGRIVTNDYNLNKVASLRGVSVININAIAESVKPVVLPGENMKVRIVKPGENTGQGVGYLEDGTMVVVESARDKVGNEIEITVTNMIQNPAGKMIFGKAEPQPRPAVPAPTPIPMPQPAPPPAKS